MEENDKNDRTPVSTNQDGVQNKPRRGDPRVKKNNSRNNSVSRTKSPAILSPNRYQVLQN